MGALSTLVHNGRELVMHKIAVVFAAVLCLSASSYANDIWQFTVTSDQSGPNWNCNELANIPCAITAHASPYILCSIIVSAPLTGYDSFDESSNGPISVEFDDVHLIQFVASSAKGLSALNWPTSQPNNYLVTNVALNEQPNSLSGSISAQLAIYDADTIVMTGMNNLWTGYWSKKGQGVHQFWARSDKVAAITQH